MRYELPCLPLIQERFWNEIKSDCVDYPSFTLHMFPQVWGSTALGFGGIGGQAISTAYTTVIQEEGSGWCAVFFSEGLAYKIKNPAQEFFEDMYKCQMSEKSRAGKYVRKD